MCIFTCRSMTVALRAERELREGRISGEVVTIEPSLTKRGCAYGIAVKTDACEKTEKILRKRHVPFGEVIR